MNRTLILVIVLIVLLGLAAVLLTRPDGGGARTTSSAPQRTPAATAGESAQAGPTLVVRVDGQEILEPVFQESSQLAHLPYNQITSSMVSHVETSGSFRTLVLTDGSRMLVDDWALQQLPAEVTYRMGYDRSE